MHFYCVNSTGIKMLKTLLIRVKRYLSGYMIQGLSSALCFCTATLILDAPVIKTVCLKFMQDILSSFSIYMIVYFYVKRKVGYHIIVLLVH